MGPRWKLTVEGLGKIEHAEVEVRPLMLFVGENNSGKSYLAALLWGLFALQAELGPPPQGPVLRACEEWLRAYPSRIGDGDGDGNGNGNGNGRPRSRCRCRCRCRCRLASPSPSPIR